MLKKSILILAVLALASPAFAADPDTAYGWIAGGWPATIVFDYREACSLPVLLKIGYYVKIFNCKNLKIVLDNDGSFNNYKGCQEFEFENNFALELSAKVEPKLKGDSTDPEVPGTYAAYIDGDKLFGPTTNGKNKATICVTLKGVNIQPLAPSCDTIQVATATILVRPQSIPNQYPCP